MLENDGIYNDLSPELRLKLTARLESFGKKVRYKFNLARPNPDPEKYNGAIIYPSLYFLHPVQWKITDNDETKERLTAGKQKVKNIAIIESSEIDKNGNKSYRYFGERIAGIEKGLKEYDMENDDHVNIVAYLELHPKMKDGLFQNKQMVPVFERIDEGAMARNERAERTSRKKAMDAAELMSDAEVVEFAEGMATDEWNSSQEMLYLRNKVEKMAEEEPGLFNDLVNSDSMKTRSIIKRAINSGVITYNPADCSLSWASTQQQIISLGLSATGANDIERLADWFLQSGDKATAALKKIKSLNEKPIKV